MPSVYAEGRAFTPGRRLLLALILADALLILHLAGSLAFATAAVLAVLALSGWAGKTTTEAVGTIQASVQITASGGLGMLVGLVFDAGPFGVLGLVAMCNASQGSTPDLDALLRHLHYMPLASLGMVAGCALWMPRLDWDRRDAALARYARHPLMGLGMLTGMLWAEGASPQILIITNNASLLVALTLVLMLAGMCAGTFAGAWLADGVQRSMRSSRS